MTISVVDGSRIVGFGMMLPVVAYALGFGLGAIRNAIRYG